VIDYDQLVDCVCDAVSAVTPSSVRIAPPDRGHLRSSVFGRSSAGPPLGGRPPCACRDHPYDSTESSNCVMK
jgi:hypothetical protein